MPRDADWSAPRRERAASFPSLKAGDYVFEVRAVSADGRHGPAASARIHAGGSGWWWAVGAGALALFGGGCLRQLQRPDRRRDLSGVPLRVFGRMEQQAEDGGRRPGPADRPRLLQD